MICSSLNGLVLSTSGSDVVTSFPNHFFVWTIFICTKNQHSYTIFLLFSLPRELIPMDLSIRSCSVPAMTSLTDTYSVVCLFFVTLWYCLLSLFAWTRFPMYCIPPRIFIFIFYRLLLVVHHTYAVSLLRHALYYNPPLNAKLYVQSPSSSTSSASSPRVVVRVHFRGDLRAKNRTWLRRRRRSRSHVTHQRVQHVSLAYYKTDPTVTTATPVIHEKSAYKCYYTRHSFLNKFEKIAMQNSSGEG